MKNFLKKNWIYVILVIIIWFFTFYVTLNRQSDNSFQSDSKPQKKIDSTIIVVDTILRLIDRKKNDEISLKKEKMMVEQQLRKERLAKSTNSSSTPVPKIIFERKEIVVEKRVEGLDPDLGHQILENFKIRNENLYLKEQLSMKDSVRIRDTL